ncbi:glycosyltransferase family 4 protein [Pseudorhodoferax sp.]|uniref:glycosyltransferase family 4 protein n=1 Tax=Pseudorhodoferax sp. TaxID=1993553 RepID=UPI002DD68242|nr:glycosyltransferase family 1 protein [Pseudorhodoferax sp.]
MNREHPPIVVDEFAPARRVLRLAIVTETYPPEVNGVAATIACCVNGLRGRGHQVQLVRPRQDRADAADGAAAEVLMRGLPIPRYPHLKMGLPATRALLRLWTLARPDVVHIVTEGPLGWSALQAARKLRLPVSSDFRTNFHAYGQHYGLGWLHKPLMAYLRKFHNRCDLTMVPTESLRQQLAGQGLERLRVVARGVDAQRFDPACRSEALRAQWGAAPDTPVVLHVGRLAPEKNLALLLQAVQAMRAIDPRVRLVMVGDGPMRAELEQACAGQGVVFAGARRGDDLAAHYASGDIFLFPSVTETFGNVTPEAMASGLAVLAYGYAAAAQLIDEGHNGLLAGYDRPAEFIAQAERLARDPALVQRLRLQARAAAVALAWPQIVAELESAFDGLTRQGGAGMLATTASRAVAGLP